MNKTGNTILVIIILIIIGFLVWWFGFNGNKTAVTTNGNAVTYVCPSGNDVTATYDQNANTVSVEEEDGTTMTLNRTQSADGGRYANTDESFVLWDKGSFAMVTRGSSTETCINEADQANVNADEQAITNTVTNFGKQLQKVSLLAPDASSTIAETYGPYVTESLLTEWTQDPSSAPGKETSSPWPDHFDIKSITPGGVVYDVNATLVFMTSNEVENGGNAGTESVDMTMAKQDGNWLIGSYTVTGTTSASETSSTGTTTE